MLGGGTGGTRGPVGIMIEIVKYDQMMCNVI